MAHKRNTHGRMYLSYSRAGKSGLPWATLVLMSLSLSETSMTVVEVCQDIGQNKPEAITAMYQSVYTAMCKLEDMGYVLSLVKSRFKLSAAGEKVISTLAFDRATPWEELSDSKYLT